MHCTAYGIAVSIGDGDYRLSIISPTGRMMATFDVRERSMFVFDTRSLGSGMYFAVVRMVYGYHPIGFEKS